MAFRSSYRRKRFVPKRAPLRRAPKRRSALRGLPGARKYALRAPQALNMRTGGFIGKELKYFNAGTGGTIIASPTNATGGEIQPTSGATNTWFAPTQGDGATNREGRRVTLTAFDLNGVIYQQTALAASGDVPLLAVVYIAVVLDTQCNGATIDSEKVFSNSLATALVNAAPQRNMEWIDRFRVLTSRRVTMRQDIFQDSLNLGAGDAGARVHTVPVSLSWRGQLEFLFTGTGVDVANLTTNALHVIAYETGGDHVLRLVAQSRGRFYG